MRVIRVIRVAELSGLSGLRSYQGYQGCGVIRVDIEVNVVFASNRKIRDIN